MNDSETTEAQRLLDRIAAGDANATEELVPLVYGELRRLAQHFLQQERPGHTLQATALVHEAYLRLLGQSRMQLQGKAHFLAVAAKMIRRVLVDHARAGGTAKRGGGAHRLSLHDDVQLVGIHSQAVDVLALHEVLEQLETLEPRQAQVVELRFFAGLTVEETAGALNVSPRTVKNDWRFARAWLRTKLAEGTLT